MDTIFEKFIDFLKDIFMLRYLPQLDQNTGYTVIFVFGLLTSFHCIAMCGGLTLSQILKKDLNVSLKFKKCIVYNIFRIISYTVTGLLAGGLGKIISFTGKMQGIIPIIGGIFMIITGANMFGTFKFLRRFSFKIPSAIFKYIMNKSTIKLKHINSLNSFSAAMFLGIISALMPCAPLQIVELYALGTGGIVSGALSMMFFSLGTVPLLFTFGIASSFISIKYTSKIIKLSSILVLFLGFSLINRGLMYFNVTIHMPSVIYSHKSDSDNIEKNFNNNKYYESSLEGDVQVVETELEKDRFPEIKVHNNIPVKWIINVKEENLNECNNEIVIRDFDISKKLEVGQNIIEFTPHEEGYINYTCWMNMIKSRIKVVQ